jgi:hypothetical protein
MKLRFISALITNEELAGMVAAMRAAKLPVRRDWDAGTVLVDVPEAGTIFRALQKGDGGPWIVRYVSNLFV